MKRPSLKREWEYWSEVTISSAQITFGVFWATLLLPRSSTKFVILLLNATICLILWFGGWLLVRKR